jgi:hypothetical protein
MPRKLGRRKKRKERKHKQKKRKEECSHFRPALLPALNAATRQREAAEPGQHRRIGTTFDCQAGIGSPRCQKFAGRQACAWTWCRSMRRVTLTWFLPPMRQLYKQHTLGCAAALHLIHARAHARTLTRSLSQSCTRTHSHARPPARTCAQVRRRAAGARGRGVSAQPAAQAAVGGEPLGRRDRGDALPFGVRGTHRARAGHVRWL